MYIKYLNRWKFILIYWFSAVKQTTMSLKKQMNDEV